jgi:hypothetical protein
VPVKRPYSYRLTIRTALGGCLGFDSFDARLLTGLQGNTSECHRHRWGPIVACRPCIEAFGGLRQARTSSERPCNVPRNAGKQILGECRESFFQILPLNPLGVMNPGLYHPTAPRLPGEVRARRAALDAKGLFMPRARDTCNAPKQLDDLPTSHWSSLPHKSGAERDHLRPSVRRQRWPQCCD